MRRLVRALEAAVYSPRTYVLAAGDTLSEAKLAEAEAGRAGQYRVARECCLRNIAVVSTFSSLTDFAINCPLIINFKCESF